MAKSEFLTFVHFSQRFSTLLVTSCYLLLPLVTSCYLLLPLVTSCYLLLPLVTSCDNSIHLGVVWHYSGHGASKNGIVDWFPLTRFDTHILFSRCTMPWHDAFGVALSVFCRFVTRVSLIWCQCQPSVFMCESARNHHVPSHSLFPICMFQMSSRGVHLWGHTYVSARIPSCAHWL
jgi:hypothetical protein